MFSCSKAAIAIALIVSVLHGSQTIQRHKQYVTGELFNKKARGAYHHLFSVEIDALLLERSQGSIKDLVVASGGPVNPTTITTACQERPPGEVMLTSRELVNKQHFRPGVAAAIYLYPSQDTTFEIRGITGLSWKGIKNIRCTQNLSLPTIGDSTDDYNHANIVRGEYLSWLKGAEVNYIRHITPRYINAFSCSGRVVGSFFEVEEALQLAFQKEGFIVDDSTTVWDHSSYRINTKALFVGGSVGFDLEYNPTHVITCGIRAKGGLGANIGKNRTRMNDLNSTETLLDYKTSGVNLAYIFTGYPFLEFRPAKSFSLLLDYQILYLGSITVAEKQAVFNAKVLVRRWEIINSRGYFFCHGLRAALKLNF
ncbi:hypothetical protein COB21_00040 [Candidatus Aerophobetes bacterium]|uniref:Uncharacterized protein n=1 Tax=Aerophobetes bacterium TaxID=2030807 RepID=A0A2A4X894_UNCAE|nr:MAG: hypothetical protein COB21_00040 [Candidatus Aerophobetes bacterium]